MYWFTLSFIICFYLIMSDFFMVELISSVSNCLIYSCFCF